MNRWWQFAVASCFVAVIFVGCDDDESSTDTGADLLDDGDAGGDVPDSDFDADLDADLAEDATEDVFIDVSEDIPLDAVGDADAGDVSDSGDTFDAGDPDVVLDRCELDFDCDSGEICQLSVCVPFVAECSETILCDGEGEVCVDGICLEPGFSPYLNDVIFNEVLTDGDTNGDPNGDGSTDDAVEEEFVELVNVSSSTIDISGWVIIERHYSIGLPRHTFEAGTEVAAGGAVVVFGGGDPPDSTASVLYLAANAQDLGFGLDLDEAGDEVELLDDADRVVAVFAYGSNGSVPAVSDESITRSPDLTGTFVRHSQAVGAGARIFSPGTRVDGTGF